MDRLQEGCGEEPEVDSSSLRVSTYERSMSTRSSVQDPTQIKLDESMAVSQVMGAAAINDSMIASGDPMD